MGRPGARFVPYDDDHLSAPCEVEERDYEEDRNAHPDCPRAPYWRGLNPEDGYERYLLLWGALHRELRGTSAWNPLWRRLGLESFKRLSALADLWMEDWNIRDREYAPEAACVAEALLIRYEALGREILGREGPSPEPGSFGPPEPRSPEWWALPEPI